MLRIERLLIARMPVLMDISNHDSDGFEFDVVVGEEEGGWGRQLPLFSAVRCFGPLAVTRVQFFSRQLAHSIRKASILRLQIRSCHAEEEDVWHSTSWLGVADKLH